MEARWEADTLRASLADGLPQVFLHSVGDASGQWLCQRFHASPLAYAICLFSGADGVRKLIAAARGRPVLRGEDIIVQASAPQAAHGGIHVYLWRHPWDQFCAGQSNDQRDASSLALLTAADAPQVLVDLRACPELPATSAMPLIGMLRGESGCV